MADFKGSRAARRVAIPGALLL